MRDETFGSGGAERSWRPMASRLAAPALRQSRLPALLIAGVLAMPVVLSSVGGASLAKFAYPAAVLLLARHLARTNPARFVAFVILVVATTAGQRHFVDWHVGYSLTNPIMLSPYLATLVTLPDVALYLLNRRRYAAVFIAMILTMLSGLVIPLLHGQLQGSLLTLLRWLCPVLFGLYILAHAGEREAIRNAVGRTFLIALPAAAVYGLVQFVAILPWDAFYMLNAKTMDSIGYPMPFLVRVFGTMNSPGSLAAMLATGALLTLPLVRGLGWIGFVLTFAALLMTTQRAALGGFTVAVVLLGLIGRDRVMRASLLRLAATLGLTMLIALSIPGASKKVATSFGSVSSLDKDDSAQVRLAQYQNFPQWLDEQPYGRGLDWVEDPAYVRVGRLIAIDSGLIDGFVTFGVPGGLLFFTTIGILVAAGAGIAARSRNPAAQAEFAAVVFGFSQLPFGAQETSEHGMFIYLAIGLLLARQVAAERDPAVSTVGA